MSKSFRRVGTRAAAEISDYEFDAPLTEDLSERRVNADPAQVAMDVLLDRMLGAVGLTVADAERHGSVVLLTVPSPEWVQVALDVWTAKIWKGERSQNGFLDFYYPNAHWTAWPAEGPGMSLMMDQAVETFSKSVAAGRHCLGVAADMSELPGDLMNGADPRLTLPVLTGTDLSAVAALASLLVERRAPDGAEVAPFLGHDSADRNSTVTL